MITGEVEYIKADELKFTTVKLNFKPLVLIYGNYGSNTYGSWAYSGFVVYNNYNEVFIPGWSSPTSSTNVGNSVTIGLASFGIDYVKLSPYPTYSPLQYIILG